MLGRRKAERINSLYGHDTMATSPVCRGEAGRGRHGNSDLASVIKSIIIGTVPGLMNNYWRGRLREAGDDLDVVGLSRAPSLDKIF